MSQLNFSELMGVYTESNQLTGHELYTDLSQEAQVYEAEQNFYHYLNECFFHQKDSYYAVWEESGHYLSALRIEPYLDGLLLCGLETHPSVRRQGYAAKLIHAVLSQLADSSVLRVYSHISKKNQPSLITHLNCGFQIIKDYAVYSDGSVLHSSYTLSIER